MRASSRGDVMQPVPWSSTLRTLLLPRFVPAPPVPVRLWAILDGLMPGRILVDNPQHPTCAMIQEYAEGTTYWGGAACAEVLPTGVNLLRRARADSGYLVNKKLIVWCFAAREFTESSGWSLVPFGSVAQPTP